MKSTLLLKLCGAVLAPACLVTCSATAAATTTNAPAEPSASAATKPESPASIQIPKSEFSVPTSAAQGRDPFFPHSIRNGAAKAGGQTSTAAPVTVTPVLQGISGQFALISGRTLKVGEDADVTVGRTKVHVHCLNIKSDSAVVEVEGRTMELKLRPGL